MACLRNLLKLLKQKSKNILVTTSTFAGWELGKGLKDLGVQVSYCPFDFGWFVWRFLRNMKPKAIIFIEKEIWPNLIFMASRRKIPIFLVSGTLTESEARRYRILKSFFGFLLGKYTQISMQSGLDVERILSLGVPEWKVRELGSLKFDISVEELRKSRNDFRFNGLTITASSTHYKDEKVIFEAFKKIETKKKITLVIAPRNIKRSKKIEKKVKRMNLEVQKWSILKKLDFKKLDFKKPALEKPALEKRVLKKRVSKRVFILDRMGELSKVYARSEIVIIGGSFGRDFGCHNFMEAALWGRAIILGAGTKNVQSFVDKFLEGEAIEQVNKENETEGLRRILRDLIENEGKRKKLSQNAKKIGSGQRGASQRNYEMLSRYDFEE